MATVWDLDMIDDDCVPFHWNESISNCAKLFSIDLWELETAGGLEKEIAWEEWEKGRNNNKIANDENGEKNKRLENEKNKNDEKKKSNKLMAVLLRFYFRLTFLRQFSVFENVDGILDLLIMDLLFFLPQTQRQWDKSNFLFKIVGFRWFHFRFFFFFLSNGRTCTRASEYAQCDFSWFFFLFCKAIRMWKYRQRWHRCYRNEFEFDGKTV